MADDDITYGEALENAISLVRGKWAAAILVALAAGPLRVGDLLDEINDTHSRRGNGDRLSYKVLNDSLKSLIVARLVSKRREPATFAAQSWCELTVDGKTLLRASRSLVQWYYDYCAATASTHTTIGPHQVAV